LQSGPHRAAAGYHVMARDQRGFGRTTGWDGAYDTDLGRYSLLKWFAMQLLPLGPYAIIELTCRPPTAR
jgi:pimeloyl-ACP methyl ester carboxylesterase